jgi:hypothetical protein
VLLLVTLWRETRNQSRRSHRTQDTGWTLWAVMMTILITQMTIANSETNPILMKKVTIKLNWVKMTSSALTLTIYQMVMTRIKQLI